MSTLTYAKHESIDLRKHPQFNEQWLQDRIAEDPTILGLGEVNVLAREHTQGKAGRLDLLLSDPDNNRRYEVELMLGPTDPSHIIRTIEYWDIERRRYPAYDHVAVLVAEDITSRFTNVLNLFAGSISIIGIQLNAMKVGEHILLDFVHVVDQTELRTDDEEEAAAKTPADRAYWHQKSSPEVMALADKTLKIINERCKTEQRLNYNRQFVGLTDGYRSRNFVTFRPRKKHLRMGALIDDRSGWEQRFADADLDAIAKPKRVWLNVTKRDFEANLELITEFLETAVSEFQQG